MKKIFSIFSVIAATVLFAACNKSPETLTEETKDNEKIQEVIKELYASAPDFIVEPATKVDREFQGSSLKFYWGDDDHLGFWPSQSDVMYGNPQQASFYINTGGDRTARARFEACGWGLIKNKQYFSYYPFNSSASYNNVRVNYTWQRQTANESTAHLGPYDYMHSAVSVIGDNTAEFKFRHLGCVEAFKLTIPQEYRSSRFTCLTLSASSAVMVSEATYNPSTLNPTLAAAQTTSNFSIDLGTESGNGITCDANGVLSVYISMAPAIGSANWSGRPVNLTLQGNNGVQFTGTINPIGTQEAGRVYLFNVNMEYDGPVITNLSRTETANCYVVSDAGDYMFRATKGNSSEAITPASVKVLWETVNTTTAPVTNYLIKDNLRYQDGYIYFSTADTFREGNAVIAAYSGANGTGNILWSWHIWCTDTPADEKYPNNAGSLMDRNLGALAASGDLANGLFYQWGRKDPFTGSATRSAKAEMAANGSGITAKTTNSSRGTIEYSIKNPYTFLAGTSSNNSDWLWSNPKVGTNWQLSNPNEDYSLWYGGADVKTKYDPCPPGYMVPYSGTDVIEPDFWGKAYGIPFQIGGTAAGFTLCGRAASYTNHVGLYMPLEDGSTAYYPTSGYLGENASRNNDGLHIMEWTNFPAGASSATTWNVQYGACLDINMDGVHAFTTHWNSGRAAGKSVRCMRMRSNLEPESSTPNEGFGTPTNSAW